MKRYIPITEVMDRYSVYRKPVDIYPLYQTYKSIYNFQNIAESVNKWVSYSKSEKKNFDKLLELFNIVDKNDCKENREVIGRNIRRIALTLESPAAYRPSLLTAIKETTDESKKNILINIYNALSEAVQCDRMIKNHSIISKTFNIDKCVREAIYEDSIPEVIYELCSFIDTYQMGIDSKYSLALEEVLLSFKKNHISIDEDTVIRNVTDYFLSNYVHENDSAKELLTILSETLDKNRFFKLNSYVNEMISECGVIIESTTQEQIMNYIEPDKKENISKIKSSANESVTYNESLMQESFKDTVKSAIDKFKLLPVKSEALFKELIRKLTVFHTDKDVLEGTVNVFSLLFYFVIVVGAFSVGIIPGIIGGLAAATIGFKVERSYFPKVLKVWYKQRDSLSRKIDKCTNPEKKKKLEVMLKELDKNIAKLEEYADNLKGSDEPTSSESRPKNYSGKDADDDMFGFNFGFDEEERNALTDIAVMCEGINSIKWDRPKMESILFTESTVAQLDNRDLDYLTEFISKYPDALDKDRWRQCLLDESTRVSKDSGYSKYVRMDICNECIKAIKSSTDTPYTEDIFLYLNNLYEYTSNITQSMYSINETGIGSTIAMAGHKLMSIASKLSDKEQIISRNIDAACRMLSRSVERANNMEDREAIIRGEILPPVSKIIKLAAATGIAYFIHPALAAITLLGKIVMSRKGRQKEKQLVIDELEVELKMIDKYISDADEKKNYKKEKELMLIKKKLQTQYDRLAYKTKYESPDGDKYKFSKDND